MPTGLTCGSSTNATALQCIGGDPQWEGGYTAVAILIAVLFLICVGISVFLIRRSAPNHCFDLTYHPQIEGPIAAPWVIAGFRGIFFVFFLVVEILQVAEYGFVVFQAYTVWNFLFQIITLGIGFQLALFFACSKRGRGHKGFYCGSDFYQQLCERFHMILLEITFPLAMLVCIVVWYVAHARATATLWSLPSVPPLQLIVSVCAVVASLS